MSDIRELNQRRAVAEMRMKALGMMNTPVEAEDQLKASAQYRLAYDAWDRAEREYRTALATLSTRDLESIAAGRPVQKDS